MGKTKFHKNALIVDNNNVALKATANKGILVSGTSRVYEDANTDTGYTIQSYRGWANITHLSVSGNLVSGLVSNTTYDVYVRARSFGTISSGSAYIGIWNGTTNGYIVASTYPFSAISTTYQTFYCFSFTTSWTVTDEVYIYMFSNELTDTTDYSEYVAVDFVELRTSTNNNVHISSNPISLDCRNIANKSACISHIDFTTSTFDSIGGHHGCNAEVPALKFCAAPSPTVTNTDDRYFLNGGYSQSINDATAYSNGRAIQAYRGWDCSCVLSNESGLKGGLEPGKDYYIYVRAKMVGSPTLSAASMGIYDATAGQLITIYDANETATNQLYPFTSLTTDYSVVYCFRFRVTWASTNFVYMYFFSNTLDNGANNYTNSIIMDYAEIWRAGNNRLALDFTMNDRDTNGNLLDCSKNQLTGNVIGGVSVVPGPAVGGNALRFDGVDSYVTCNDVCQYITGSFSIEGWFRFNSLTTRQCLFGINVNDATATTAFLLLLNGNATDGTLDVYYSGTNSVMDTTFTPELNRWYKIVIYLDTLNNLLYLYIDNKFIAYVSDVTTRVAAGYYFSLGQEWDSSTPTDFFNGDIGPFRVYSTVIDIKPSIAPESGKNLLDLLDRDWRDPSNWTSSSTLSWDPVENALCAYDTSPTHIFPFPIYVDPSKHWYLEATIERESSADGVFYLGRQFYQDTYIENTWYLKHGGGTYDYVGASACQPTANTWTTYKNNTINGRANTGVNQSSYQTFNCSPRVTYMNVLIITNYNGTAPAKYWIKDLKLYYIDPDESGMARNCNGLLCNPTATNLLTNGSFDTGALSPWNVWGTATVSIQDNYGSKMLYVKTDGTINSGIFYNNISLGSSYSQVVTISCDIKVIKYSGALRLLIYDGSYYYYVPVLSSWEKDGKWHRLEYELILPVGATSISVYIGGASGGVISEFLLDNVEVRKEINYLQNPSGYSISNGTPGNYQPGWDATLHNDAIVVNNWSSGYNEGVPSPSIGYHARWVYGGRSGSTDPCILFQDQNSTYGLSHRWLGIAQNFSPAWVPGTVLTISWYQKSSVLNKGAAVGVYHYSRSGRCFTFDDCICDVLCSSVNYWEKASFTYTVTSDWDVHSDSCYLYIYGMGGPEGLLYVDDMSLTVKNYSLHYALSRKHFLTASNLEGSIVFTVKTGINNINAFGNWRQLFRTNLHETVGGANLMLNTANHLLFYHQSNYGTISMGSPAPLTWQPNHTYHIVLNFSQSNSNVYFYVTDTTDRSNSNTTAYLINWRWDYFLVDTLHMLDTAEFFTIESISFYNRPMRADEITKLTKSSMSIESDGKITVKNIKERPACIPPTAIYFPFDSTTPKDEYSRISPATSSNLVMTNHGLFVGSATTNLYNAAAQNFSSWYTYMGETVTIRQLSAGGTHLTGNGAGTHVIKFACAGASPSTNGIYYTASMYVYNISKTTPCIVSSNIQVVIPNSNLPIQCVVLPGEFKHVQLGWVGNGISNAQINISVPFASDVFNIIAYQPMMSSGTAVCYPFTATSQSSATLAYNLYRDAGIQWNQDWSICYWKIPLATSSNGLDGYSVECLGGWYTGCTTNRYICWGKLDGQNRFMSGYDASYVEFTPSLYFNKLVFVCVRYNSVAKTRTIEWHGPFGDIVTTNGLNILEANAYLYNGTDFTRASDFTISIADEDLQANAIFPFGLVVEQRCWTDVEVEQMRKVSTKIKENTLTNSKIILKGDKGTNYIEGDIYNNDTWYLIP